MSVFHGNVRVLAITLAYNIFDAQNRTWALAPSGSLGASSGLIVGKTLIIFICTRALNKKKERIEVDSLFNSTWYHFKMHMPETSHQ